MCQIKYKSTFNVYRITDLKKKKKKKKRKKPFTKAPLTGRLHATYFSHFRNCDDFFLPLGLE